MSFSKSFSALIILGVLSLSVPAWADVAPDDACYANEVGKACNNAQDKDGNRFAAGECQQTMCTRAMRDGSSITYACYRCEVVNEGMGGQSNEGGAAGAGETNSAGTVATAGAPTNAPGGSSAGGATNGSAGAGTAGTKAGSAGAAAAKPTSDDGGGCSVTHVRGGAGALGAALAALGLAVAALRRRKALAS